MKPNTPTWVVWWFGAVYLEGACDCSRKVDLGRPAIARVRESLSVPKPLFALTQLLLDSASTTFFAEAMWRTSCAACRPRPSRIRAQTVFSAKLLDQPRRKTCANAALSMQIRKRPHGRTRASPYSKARASRTAMASSSPKVPHARSGSKSAPAVFSCAFSNQNAPHPFGQASVNRTISSGSGVVTLRGGASSSSLFHAAKASRAQFHEHTGRSSGHAPRRRRNL